ncbi:MAG: hypothetical protein EOO16_09470 [Chitinophagaceae bacterium]|nr:MAG: hypothetical protein EOO16_09470 [Chitinophagaceae bacterium]
MTTYLIIAAVLGVISCVAFLVINSGKVDARNRRTMLFLLVGAIVLTLPGFAGMLPGVFDHMSWFILLQLYSLGMGIVHVLLLRRGFFGEHEKPTLSRSLLTLANASFGYIGFLLLFDNGNDAGLAPDFGMALLLFPVPWLFHSTFDLLAAIPPEIFKIWYYPLEEAEPDFDSIDLNKILIVELEFSKSPHDQTMTNFKARAPLDMRFSDWFRSFINNYNYKFENEPIEYVDGGHRPHGWMFYTKPTVLRPKRFVDPDLTIKDNSISEKWVILAKRIREEDLN